MKANEKAEELINKYYLELKEHKGYYDLETAKQCALIAVDEILDILEYPSEQYLYYLDVKVELISL